MKGRPTNPMKLNDCMEESAKSSTSCFEKTGESHKFVFDLRLFQLVSQFRLGYISNASHDEGESKVKLGSRSKKLN